MKQATYYEAFDHDGCWAGTATLAAIIAAGLEPNLRYVMYGREKLAVDGWACKAGQRRAA